MESITLTRIGLNSILLLTITQMSQMKMVNPIMSGPPRKSQVAIGFLNYTCTGTDPFEKQLDPFGPIASRGRLERPSEKCVDDENTTRQDHPDRIFRPRLYKGFYMSAKVLMSCYFWFVFILILYVPVNNFLLCRYGSGLPGLNQY